MAKRKVPKRFAMSKDKKTLFIFANTEQRREAIKNENLKAISRAESIERAVTGMGTITIVNRSKG